MATLRTAPTLADVQEARRRLAGIAEETPIYLSETFSRRAGRQVLLKAENLQRTGSFKIRGAYNTIALLGAGERSNRAVNWALQIHGGYGFMDEFAISRLFRDQKILEIGEGTNEVQRMVIAKHLGF